MLRIVTKLSPTVAGGPWFSVQHFGGSDITAANSAISALTTFWNAITSELQCGGTAVVGFRALVVNPATGKTTGELSPTPGSVALTGGGQPVTLISQARIDLLTGVFVDGHQVRGKMFIPGVSETRSDLGAPSTTVLTNIKTAADALIANTSTTWEVYSKKHFSEHEISGTRMYTNFASLRSRRDS